VALLVALSDGDGFIQLAILEGASNLLHEHARLLACRAVHQGSVDHDTERIHRQHKQDSDDNSRQGTH